MSDSQQGGVMDGVNERSHVCAERWGNAELESGGGGGG